MAALHPRSLSAGIGTADIERARHPSQPLDLQEERSTWPLHFDGHLSADYSSALQPQSGNRMAALDTIGNLTVLTQAMNSSVSNGPWKNKRRELLRASLLLINQQLHRYAERNDGMIEKRGRELLGRAVRIWPGPPASF
ncbi:MAG: HNH endonuclease family protein [Phycisphaerales bacterium]